ncbi:hypothetical protein Tco_0373438 [Tanacetum coccineum]
MKKNTLRRSGVRRSTVGLSKKSNHLRNKLIDRSVTPPNLSTQRNVEYPRALHLRINSTGSGVRRNPVGLSKKSNHLRNKLIDRRGKAEGRPLKIDEIEACQRDRIDWTEKDDLKAKMLRQKARVKWNQIEVVHVLQAVISEGYLKIIKEELLTTIKWLWEEDKISRAGNTSFTALLSKVVDAVCLAELRAEGSKLRVEGFGVDLMKRSGGRTLLTQKLLGILLLSRAEED